MRVHTWAFALRPVLFFKLIKSLFSQLELSVSIAMGLLGALLPGTSGMTWSPGWFGHGKLRTWLACLFAKVVERYCFTCCLWACCMWYLVGFSRWVCTLRTSMGTWVAEGSVVGTLTFMAGVGLTGTLCCMNWAACSFCCCSCVPAPASAHA